MHNYRFTISIPTHDRPHLLPRALDSALRQSVPARIVISDNGDSDRTAAILRDQYGEPLRSGQVVHRLIPGGTPWQNWKNAMEVVDTEYVSFFQDDDVICKTYVERITYGFDKAMKLGARPYVWMGRLECADPTGRQGLAYIGNGPWVPTESLYGESEPGHWRDGTVIAVSSYFTSWSLSPAIAYRTGPRLTATLNAMPGDADLFIERLMPSEMALVGGFIADGERVGRWVQHDDHLSHKQHADQPRQTGVLIKYLDDLLDRLPRWRRPFTAWCGIVPPAALLAWLEQLDVTEREGGKSRHAREIRRIMWESAMSRCKRVPGPKEKRIRKAFAGVGRWLKGKAALA